MNDAGAEISVGPWRRLAVTVALLCGLLAVTSWWPWLDGPITAAISAGVIVWVLVRGPRWMRLWMLTIIGCIAVVFGIIVLLAWS